MSEKQQSLQTDYAPDRFTRKNQQLPISGRISADTVVNLNLSNRCISLLGYGKEDHKTITNLYTTPLNAYW